MFAIPDASANLVEHVTRGRRRDAIGVELDDPVVTEDSVNRREAPQFMLKHFIEF